MSNRCMESYCFAIHVYETFKGPVAHLVPYQVDREATPVLPLGAQSLTPVTRGTLWLQAVLVGDVSHMVHGQEVIQLVQVSDS